MLEIWWAIFWLILFAKSCNGVHFLGPYTYRHNFLTGDEMYAKVNSLTSMKSVLPFSYYTLPYCVPKMGIKESEMNLGQLLLGHQILNSGYRFRMNVNETVHLCTRPALRTDEVKILSQRVDDIYKVNMFLDDLPVMRPFKKNGLIINQGTGFPVGITTFYSNNLYYIFNHLHFRVLIHGHEEAGGLESFEIVGFEVVPCSVKHNPETMPKLGMYEKLQPIYCPMNLEDSQVIRENETITFSYNVEFVKSDISWDSRWDAYFESGNSKIRFNSVVNSVITVLFLASLMVAIYLRRVRRELIKEEPNPMSKINNLPGWKVIAGDVFREPKCGKLLCIMVGDGIRITLTALTVALVSISSIFVSPASKGRLLMTVIALYLGYGIVSGYVTVRIWRTIKGTSNTWKSVSWCVACFFPGLVFVVFSCSNAFFYGANSTKAIPVSLFLILLSLWLFISVPFTLIGGYIGSKSDHIQYPVAVQTNNVGREIPRGKFLLRLLVVGAGILPFETLFIELFYMLTDIWFGRFNLKLGYLGFALVMLVLVSAIVSVILTFTRLRFEDWGWWWKAFLASGSAGVYVLCYTINYLVCHLRGLNGLVDVGVYIGYSLIAAVAVMMASGAVGFIVSFYFVHTLYSSFKVGC